MHPPLSFHLHPDSAEDGQQALGNERLQKSPFPVSQGEFNPTPPTRYQIHRYRASGVFPTCSVLDSVPFLVVKSGPCVRAPFVPSMIPGQRFNVCYNMSPRNRHFGGSPVCLQTKKPEAVGRSENLFL